MIPKFEIVQEYKMVQEVPSLKTMPETLSFKTIQENNIIKHIEKIDVSKYTKIELIDARKVCSNPTFKYAIILPLFGGLTYLYPDEISNRKYFLNEKEIKLPTDSIEHLYIEMYKLIHNEYIKSLLEEL
jgi:hypothetical protein